MRVVYREDASSQRARTSKESSKPVKGGPNPKPHFSPSVDSPSSGCKRGERDAKGIKTRGRSGIEVIRNDSQHERSRDEKTAMLARNRETLLVVAATHSRKRDRELLPTPVRSHKHTRSWEWILTVSVQGKKIQERKKERKNSRKSIYIYIINKDR